MQVLLSIGLIILALSILIVIHELGHFWAARIFKMRVEEFALFFGPKLFGFKKGDTEWRINAIPLGGYVKISGMLDESFDKEQLEKEPEPWEFRSKPIWQRLIVMLGGIIMNVILGCVIFIGIKYFMGEYSVPIENLEYGIYVMEGTPAEDMGFKTGDQIVSYNGEPVADFNMVADPNILMDQGKEFEVRRNGELIKIQVADDYIDKWLDFPKEKRGSHLFDPDMKPILYVIDEEAQKSIKEQSDADVSINAYKAGIRTRDVVVAVNGTRVQKWSEFHTLMKGQPESEVKITVDRDGKEMTFAVATDTASKIGAAAYTDTLRKHTEFGLGESIPVGITAAFKELTKTIKGLYMTFTGKVNPTKSVAGPVKIAKMYGQTFNSGGWANFWALTGMLSMVLAIMNLLPIPVLDGGQVLILSIEGIIGREIPMKTKEIILQIGFWMVVGLMVFVLLNDIIGL